MKPINYFDGELYDIRLTDGNIIRGMTVSVIDDLCACDLRVLDTEQLVVVPLMWGEITAMVPAQKIPRE